MSVIGPSREAAFFGPTLRLDRGILLNAFLETRPRYTLRSDRPSRIAPANCSACWRRSTRAEPGWSPTSRPPQTRSPGPRLLVRPLLLFASVALVIGFVAVRTDVEPYKTQFFRLFFSNTLHMKAWLTTAALLLGLGQLLTAARIYGKLRFPPEGRLYPLLHRWSGRAAILLTVPAAYHCIFKLGFGTNDARAFIHSLLGASFYGAFSAKVLIVRTSGYPGWALPMAGGVLFAILMVLWLTSAFWLFGTHGVSL